MNYELLFKPLQVRSLILKNRIACAPMTGPGEGQPSIKPSALEYGGFSMFDRSIGGAALLYRGLNIPLSLENPASDKEYGLSKYKREMVKEHLSVIRQKGAKAGVELCHQGIYGHEADGKVYGPSAGFTDKGEPIIPMDEAKMQDIANRFAYAAREAKQYGFDLILLHFGHGWLIHQFLSPFFNSRTDEYGGSIENRIRFPMMVIEAVRNAVGKDFPIEMRISTEECISSDKRLPLDDVITFIQHAEPYIDIVNCSRGLDMIREANIHHAATIFEPHITNLEALRKIRANTSCLLSVVGSIMTPEEAESLLEEGSADLIMLGRSTLADPFWPVKAQMGHSEDIVPCIRCLQCYHVSTDHKNVQCSVNPRFNREKRVPLILPVTGHPKHLVIVGGGPAGITCALTASRRGHQVTLLEKEPVLTGKLNIACHGEHKADLRRFRDYLLTQLRKSSVTVHTGVLADTDVVRDLKPDALVIAVGATPSRIPLPGVDGDNCIQISEFLQSPDTSLQHYIIIGGGSVGCETALDLAEKGKDVSIIEMADCLASASNDLYRLALSEHFARYDNLHTYLNSACQSIDADGVNVLINGASTHISGDKVLLSLGFRPDAKQVSSLYGIVPDTYYVGDCERVATVAEAVNNAYFIGANVFQEQDII